MSFVYCSFAVLLRFATASYETKSTDCFFAKIFQDFHDYEVLYHYDNKTPIDCFLGETNHCRVTLLFNYDINTTNLERPLGRKYLDVIYLTDPKRFEDFSSRNFNIQFVDVVFFVVQKNRNYQNRFGKRLANAGGLFIYEISNKKLFYVKYYYGNQTGVANPTKRGEQLSKYLNNFHHFNNHEFKIGYIPYKPFISCGSNSEPNEKCVPEGLEGEIILGLSKKSNFKFTLISFEGGSWRDLVNNVNLNQIDWAVGAIRATLNRRKKVDFTGSIKLESYLILLSNRETFTRQWNYMLRSYQPSVWIVFGVSVILFGILLGLAKLSNSRPTELFRYLLVPFQIFIEQPSVRGLYRSCFSRPLLVLWFLMSIILNTAYKSKLTSTMITPKPSTINTIDELLEDNYRFQVNHVDWSALKENLESTPDPVFGKVALRCRNDLNLCRSVEAILSGGAAIFEEETPIKYEILSHCSHVLTPEKRSTLRLLRPRLFPIELGWPMAFSTPYRTVFSEFIQRKIDAGHVRHWENLELSKQRILFSNEIDSHRDVRAIDVRMLRAAGLLLLIGHATAALIFLWERYGGERKEKKSVKI